MEQNKNEQKPDRQSAAPFAQTFFHGTKADLKLGDLIEAGLTRTLDKEKKRNTFFYQRH
jgi:hypothetical protein